MRFLREFGVLAAGILLMIAGTAIIAAPDPTGFGWTAYTPLDGPEMWSVPVLPSYDWIGYFVSALGVAAAAGWVGYRIGRRARR